MISIAYQRELEEICRLDLPWEEFREARFLITGAGGLIGSYLTEALLKMNEVLELGLHVTALCRSREKAYRRFHDCLDREDFSLLLGDVCQEGLYRNGEWDYIVHGAGHAHPQAFYSEPVETMKANLIGTMQLLDYMVSQEIRHTVKKMVFLSSGEVYGDSPMPGPEGWTEKCAGSVRNLEVRACYPESKRAAETLCVSYVQEYSIQAVIARLGYVYGTTIQEDSTRADAQFILRAAAGDNIILKSKGTQYRSYCYLADAIAALLFLLIKGEAGKAYNVANADSKATVREFAEAAAKAFQVSICYEPPQTTEAAGYSRMKQEILDASSLMKLGWKPGYSLQDGMNRVREILRPATGEESPESEPYSL